MGLLVSYKVLLISLFVFPVVVLVIGLCGKVKLRVSNYVDDPRKLWLYTIYNEIYNIMSSYESHSRTKKETDVRKPMKCSDTTLAHECAQLRLQEARIYIIHIS